jgi:hypothetical protein
MLLSRVGYSVVARQWDGDPRFWDARRRALDLHQRVSELHRTWHDGGGAHPWALAAAKIATMWVVARARTRMERLSRCGGYTRLDLPIIRVLAKPTGPIAAGMGEGAAGPGGER